MPGGKPILHRSLRARSLPQAKSIRDNVTAILQREFEAAKEYVPSAKDWLSSYWSGFMSPHQKARIRNTGAALGFTSISFRGSLWL